MVNGGSGTDDTRNIGRSVGDGPNDGSVPRRQFLRTAGAGATVATLAGCTDTIGGGGGGIPDTVSIGALGPMSLPMGKSIINAAKLAAEEINKNGGIDGSDVEIISKDTKDDPSTTRSAYQELTTAENVAATLGIFGSEQLLAIMPNMASQSTVHMTAGAATPEAPKKVANNYEKFKYWFRSGPPNSVYLAESLVEFGEDEFGNMGWDRIAFLTEDYKWTEPVSRIVSNRLAQKSGAEVVYNKRIAADTKDFTPIYDELASRNVDGAYVALAHKGTTSLVQWAKQQRQFGYGGIHVPAQLPSYFQATKGACIATFSQTTATPDSEVTDKTVPFANAYQKKFGGYPVYTGYSAYDGVYVLKRAMEETGSVAGDDLVPALEDTSYTGTSGTIDFFQEGGRFPHDIKFGPDFVRGVYFQWQTEGEKGVQEVIWPESLQSAEYIQAPWIQ